MPADHVLIRTHYSLISAGTELACLSGSETWFKMPRSPGYASVGEVVAKGDNVTRVAVGDLVFQHGHHEEVSLQPAQGILMKAPETLEEQLVPFARMATIAMAAIRVSDIELGDYVAVTGQGLVGNMAAQLAGLQGASVIAVDVNESRLQRSRQCGIELCVNPGQCDMREEVMKLTGSQGVSTLIEASGVTQVVMDALPLTGNSGEMILLGSPRGEHQADITDLLNYCHLSGRGGITFKGAHEWGFPVEHDNFVKHSIERNTRIAFDLMANRRLRVEPLLSHVVKPHDVAGAYEGLKNNKDDYMGVVIDWT